MSNEPIQESRPYPNEHACRIRPPSEYKEFRRENGAFKVDGKPVDVIWGIKVENGNRKAEMQSLRYKKDMWDADDARKHCERMGGSFEPAAGEKHISVDGMQYRYLRFSPAFDTETRRITLSFSSEEPVRRWFGYEILSHEPKSVRLQRIKETGTLLINHDPDKAVGVVEDAWIDPKNKRGIAIVRFGRSQLAEEVWRDVQEGVWRNVSVGYVIHDLALVEEKDDISTYRATDWEPLEISLVSVPADPNVGVGRSRDQTTPKPDKEEKHMAEVNTQQNTQQEPVEAQRQQPAQHQAVVVNDDESVKRERKRISEILALGEQHRCQELARQAVAEGISVEDFKGWILERIYGARKIEHVDPRIGMNEKEAQQFSFIRAINALAKGDWSLAPYEKEASDAVAKKLRKEPRGCFVPYDVLTTPLKRAVTKAGTGQYLIETELRIQDFIELLRSKVMVRKLGARVLGGLVGNLAIPKQTGGAVAYWLPDETTEITESTPTFAQVGLTPKVVGALTEVSHTMLRQSSPDIEQMVREDLATTLALAIDAAAIKGTGTNGEPTGIINTSGISVVAIGTDGGAPQYSHIVSLWSAVAQQDAAMGRLAWLTNAIMIAKLSQTEKAASTGKFIIEELPGEDGITTMLGIKCGMSNQVPSNLTKGTNNDCSAIIFGNWADLMIGEWGAIDLLADPYTKSATGAVRVRVLQDVDIALRHTESFAAILDARDV